MFRLFLQLAASQNRVYLNAESLMINLTESSFDAGIQKMTVDKKKWLDDTKPLLQSSIQLCVDHVFPDTNPGPIS